MDENDFEFGEVWDEFQWEKFLKEQDEKAETYFGLAEKLEQDSDEEDSPAPEPGWASAFAAGESDSKEEPLDDLDDSEAWEPENSDDDEADSPPQELLLHAAYSDILALENWIDECVANSQDLEDDENFQDFCLRLGQCEAELAAAISNRADAEEGTFEVGMIITLLKRSLHASHGCLHSLAALEKKCLISPATAKFARNALFEVRNAIVDDLGDMRALWKQRNEGRE